MKITLKDLIEQGIIDENQKLIIYSLHNNDWVRIYKGYAYSLIAENHSILNEEEFTIQEIRKEDMDYLIKCGFKKDYIGIYVG